MTTSAATLDAEMIDLDIAEMPAEMPKATGKHPPKQLFAAVLAVAVYPVITALLYIIMPLTEGWTLWQRALVLTPIMVFSIVFFVSPAIQKYLGRFLARLAR